MWTYQDCVEAYARRRKGSNFKKTHGNVHMRHEATDSHSSFIFKFYNTDIVEVRQSFDTKLVHHLVTYYQSSTTVARISDIAGVGIFYHPRSPVWCPSNTTRVNWLVKRTFKLEHMDKPIEVRGLPFTDGMRFQNTKALGDFATEQFKVLDHAQDLERKRKLRPWLDGIKVAIELTQGTELKEPHLDMWTAKKVLCQAIDRNEAFDLAPVLDYVQATWYRRQHRFVRRHKELNITKEVYSEVTKELLNHTRYNIPRVMVTGYLLDDSE